MRADFTPFGIEKTKDHRSGCWKPESQQRHFNKGIRCVRQEFQTVGRGCGNMLEGRMKTTHSIGCPLTFVMA